MTAGYSASHANHGKGSAYDDDFLASSFLSYLWARERELLRSLVSSEGAQGGTPLKYLDFACGTGRILAALEDLAQDSVGVDISRAMLEQARKKVRRSDLVEGDFIGVPSLVSGHFDVATAFRFFPNADKELSRSAASFLALKVAPGGLLIVNNHQNQNSLLSLLGRVARRRWAWQPMRNRELVQLLEGVGFSLVGSRSFGMLPGTARRSHFPEWIHTAADSVGSLPFLRWLGQDVVLWFRR